MQSHDYRSVCGMLLINGSKKSLFIVETRSQLHVSAETKTTSGCAQVNRVSGVVITVLCHTLCSICVKIDFIKIILIYDGFSIIVMVEAQVLHT